MEYLLVSVKEAIEILLAEGIVGVPTETVYGLAALASSDEAVRKIFAAKGRPADNPLIAHVSGILQAESIGEVSPEARLLMESFWPGPLTIILPYERGVCTTARAGMNTVAVRMPDHEMLLDVINGVGQPLVAPSANKSGNPSPTTAEHVLEDYGDAVKVLDGGPCRIGLESTVIRLKGKTVSILRPGAIGVSDLVKLGFDVHDNPHELHRSPGTRHKHYTPRATVRLFANPDELSASLQQDKTSIVLAPYPISSEGEWRLLDPRTLYSEFRRADVLGVEEILVLCDTTVRQNPALMDRLLKASESGTNHTGK